MLDNLPENARKYGDPGTAITLQVVQQADVITIEVEDIGRGIAPGDLPHLFEPSCRAESHCGTIDIDAENTTGRGSRLTARFPRAIGP